jgi:drug/metabolite transporter (DMT)-like permease
MSVAAALPRPVTIALQTAAAMVAFAANSLFCRVALSGNLLDAPSFATLRIASGGLLLFWLVRTRNGAGSRREPIDWIGSISLAVYLLPFTLAYLTLDTGTGALLLFGAAQLTMLGMGLAHGERPSWSGWCGIAAATAGFVWLLAPGAGAPPLVGGGLMTVAGIAWGMFSLRGRLSAAPIAATARAFLFALPWVLVVNLAFLSDVHWTLEGAALAIASGTIASALGYIAWYTALPHLSAIAAGTVQLSVPVIAAIGGTLFLGEQPSLRWLACGAAILGGIALVGRQGRARSAASP